MGLTNLAAILDPAAPDDRAFIIQVSPEADEELRLSYGQARSRIAALAPVIPVLTIDRVEEAVPLARALMRGGLPATLKEGWFSGYRWYQV